MHGIEILFWFSFIVVVYTYIGYGALLFLLVTIKEFFIPPQQLQLPNPLPEITLLIAAYNEEACVEAKMDNTLALDYPADRLHIVWVTDGSTDRTNQLLHTYPQVRVLYEATRRGKSAALNRAMPYVTTPLVVFTDANTLLNDQSVREIVRRFVDHRVGCVAGEKRVQVQQTQDATAGEGLYWKYESTLKAWDDRLYSAVGAAGELFALRVQLYEKLPDSTLLDDFVLSMRIAQRGYKIAYCKQAYAVETASADMQQELKRKIRIAAGGLQSIRMLRSLLNLFRYRTLSFQYISHRVLRWSITPLLWFALLPLNLLLAWGETPLYRVILAFHLLFYGLAYGGYLLNKRQIKNKFLFIPYYFLFMNSCVLRGFVYLKNDKGSGVWEKAERRS